MIFRCETCSTACFCDTDPADENTWPMCLVCTEAMTPTDEEVFW